MNIKDSIFYENEINAIKRELESLPDGHLTTQGSRFYETIGTIRKGITKDPERVRQLARKAYLLRRLGHLEWNYSLLKKQAGRYKTEDPTEIIQGLSSFYKTLPVDYFFHASVCDQMKNVSKGNAGHTDELIYLTRSGISVRSKSERTIADALYQNKIPYSYETTLALGDKKTHPDFTIYRPFDGKVFLWEHFGLMSHSDYRQNVIAKISLYVRYGFFPFENLICTFEQDLLDPAQIQALIKVFLLR